MGPLSRAWKLARDIIRRSGAGRRARDNEIRREAGKEATKEYRDWEHREREREAYERDDRVRELDDADRRGRTG